MLKQLFYLLLLSSTLYTHEVHLWDEESYYNNNHAQQRIADYLLEKFKFHGKEKILDLGCGKGKITAQLTRSVSHGYVIGLDLSPNMVKYAQERFPVERYPNLAFYQGDANSIDYQNQFDVIFSFTGLQWVPDHEATLLKMYHALKHSGSVALSMPLGLPISLEQALGELMIQEKWRAFFPNDFQPGFNFISLENYRKLLLKTGFAIDLIEKRSQKDTFKTKGEFIDFVSQWFPYLRPIPKQLRTEFMNCLVNRYCELEEIDENQEIYFLPYQLAVIAHKK